MRIVHNLENFVAPWEKSVLTAGVFDGMHQGHTALLRQIESTEGMERILVTYDPHPDRILGKNKNVRSELFIYPEKLSLLQSRFRLDTVVFLPFSTKLAEMKAEEYLETILIRQLKAHKIVIGYDQCFGKNRRGDFHFLKEREAQFGYETVRLDPLRYDGEIISSSKIRSYIHDGEIEKANGMLGHQFFVTGDVIRGVGRGAKLGFPTANLDIEATKVLPKEGVYAAIAVQEGERFRAMVNIGHNPTFDRNILIVEAHILDFSRDLYGKNLRIHFVKRLRDEIAFPSKEALIEQLRFDREQVLSLDML